MDPLPGVGINKLPQELIDQVLAQLPTRDKSRLARCNRTLYCRTLDDLYASGDDRNSAVKWACQKGVISTLDQAFSRGAPVSTVYMAPGRPTSEKKLTLYLALRSCQRAVFFYLVEQGARIDIPDVSPCSFANKLFLTTSNLTAVGWFLEAGLASQLSQSTRDQALWYILRNSSAHGMRMVGVDPARARDYIRHLLDAGSDPNLVSLLGPVFGSRSTSPLSAAVQANRPDLVRILIERGADVNGPLTVPGREPTGLPLHVPVCSAAFTMAQPGRDSSSMQILLACGADLKICVPFYNKDSSRPGMTVLSFTTPLAMFLTNVSRWPNAKRRTNNRETKKKDICIKTAVENLQVLLDNGAAQSLGLICSQEPKRVEIPYQGRYQFEPLPSPVEKLISNMKAPPTTTCDSTYYSFLLMASILKVLIRHAIPSDGMILELFRFFGAYHDFFLPSGRKVSHLTKEKLCGFRPGREQISGSTVFTAKPDHTSFLSFWLDILDSIVETPHYQQSLNLFLYCYVLAQGSRSNHPGADAGPQDLTDAKEALFRETVTRFLHAGANINFRIPEDCCLPDFKRGSTVLQALSMLQL